MPIEPKRTLISEGPMVARRGAGRGYASKTTIERHWSDGFVDYACAVDGCDFTTEKRGGIAPHRKTHVNSGEVEKQGPNHEPATIAIPPYEPAYTKDSYTPRTDRVKALAAALRAAMDAGLDWSDLDAATETLAAEALAWAHQQSSDSSGLAAEREPLTPEEMLTRIRNMLDNGEYLAQRQQIDELRIRVTEMERRESAAVEEAKDLQETLDTLRDLIPTRKETA